MNDPIPTLLCADRRLSQTPLWAIQRHYFLDAGISAWQGDVVPSDISSNPHMARAYADVVLGFLRDVHADPAYDLKRDEPIYIVELGAGAGRLGYHFLNHFFPRYEAAPFAAAPVTYILTDFVPSLLDFWRAHRRFQPWVETGRLDFALFDAVAPAPLALSESGRRLDQPANPVILLANYFFDGIPQDSFVLENGQLHENLVTIGSNRPEPDLSDQTIWDRLTISYEAVPTPPPYYDQPLYDDILADYEGSLPDTTLLFPNTGLDCLRFWEKLSGDRLLLLSADKGFTLPEAIHSQADPDIARHGSFSMMVNYHALGEYVHRRGGLALQPAHYQDNIQVGAYLLGPRPQDAAETVAAFRRALDGGPDDFFGIKKAFTAHHVDFNLPQLLSFIRLSAYDAVVLRKCLPALRQQLKKVGVVWYGDVQLVLDQVWANYLPIGEPYDLALQIGLTSMDMGHFEEALRYFAASARDYGESEALRTYIDRCQAALS